MYKKVKFYQSEKAQGKYQVPTEMKELVKILEDESLRQAITKKI